MGATVKRPDGDLDDWLFSEDEDADDTAEGIELAEALRAAGLLAEDDEPGED